jgi:hypothetical protein
VVVLVLVGSTAAAAAALAVADDERGAFLVRALDAAEVAMLRNMADTDMLVATACGAPPPTLLARRVVRGAVGAATISTALLDEDASLSSISSS